MSDIINLIRQILIRIEALEKKSAVANIPLAGAYLATPVALGNNSWAKLALDTIRLTRGNVTVDLANDRIKTDVAGKYRITATVRFADNTTGSRGIEIKKNNGAITGNTQFFTRVDASGRASITQCLVLDLAKDDYIEVFGFQDSGSGLNIVHYNLTAEYI